MATERESFTKTETRRLPSVRGNRSSGVADHDAVSVFAPYLGQLSLRLPSIVLFARQLGIGVKGLMGSCG